MPGARLDFQELRRRVEQAEPLAAVGRLQELVGLVLKSRGPECAVGSICSLDHPASGAVSLAEVVGFRQGQVLLMPYGELRGIRPRMRVVLEERQAGARVGMGLLGRVLDGLGAPLDGLGPLQDADESYPLYGTPLNPCARERITQPLDVGIRAINGLLTVGKGQRLGIFAGSGVGKSTLMGMMARFTASQVSVIGLIG